MSLLTLLILGRHTQVRSVLPGRRYLPVFLAAILALVSAAISFGPVQAQSPRGMQIPPVTLPDKESTEAELKKLPPVAPSTTTQRVIVDTDPGVDDAAAILWLFSQDNYPADVVGLVTVAGNTTVENATTNALILRSLVGGDFAVVQGAAGPLVRPLSLTGLSIHGPDGLWGLGAGIPVDPAGIDPRRATAFYCGTESQPASLTSGTLVVALGPLTNLATAIQTCPTLWNGVRIVSLGGAKYGGNQTPVAEFNYWQDPEAAQIVLGNSLALNYTVDMVLLDAFKQFDIQSRDLFAARPQGPLAVLAPALQAYLAVSGFEAAPTLPDVAAMMYALGSPASTTQSALVKVLGEAQLENEGDRLARGQTIIGLSLAERISMIANEEQFNALSQLNLALTLAYFTGADTSVLEAQLGAQLGALLMSDPDNARVVVDIDGNRMVRQFIGDLRSQNGTAARSVSVSASSVARTGSVPAAASQRLFVPLVVD